MRHHYVPKFLMRRWAFIDSHGQSKLPGFYWDERKQRLRMFPGGADQFCNADGLWSFEAPHPEGRDAIETSFFQQVDNAAARVIAKLVEGREKSSHLSEALIIFMLSLDVRRPNVVNTLKTQGADYFRDGFNSDPLITEMLRATGSTETVAEAYERLYQSPIVDRTLLLLQTLSLNPSLLKRLANYRFMTARLGLYDGTYVLSDRPLVRINPSDSDMNVWALPLSPKLALFAMATAVIEESLKRQPIKRLRNALNTMSAGNCDRYVFSTERSGLEWLSRRLRRERATGPEILTEIKPRRKSVL